MNYVNGFKTFVDNQPVAQVIKIMAILAVLGGLALIMAAFGLFALGAFTGTLGAAMGVGFLYGPLAVIWGLVTLVEGVAELLFGYGAWFLKPWALKLGVLIQYANIAVSFINWIGGLSGFFSFLISALISGLIIYYLQRPQVKAYFGVK